MTFHTSHHRPKCSICLKQFLPNDVIAWAMDGGNRPSNDEPLSASHGINRNDDNSGAGCIHIFYEECLVAWLQHHDECTLCGQKVVYANVDATLGDLEGARNY